MDERIQETEDIAARQRADALSNEIIGAAIEVHTLTPHENREYI